MDASVIQTAVPLLTQFGLKGARRHRLVVNRLLGGAGATAQGSATALQRL
jgi:hypothetical protein